MNKKRCWDSNIVANGSILLEVNPDPPNVHFMGIESRSNLQDLCCIWLAIVPHPVAWEPVHVDVGVPRSTGVVLGRNKVWVDLADYTARFLYSRMVALVKSSPLA